MTKRCLATTRPVIFFSCDGSKQGFADLRLVPFDMRDWSSSLPFSFGDPYHVVYSVLQFLIPVHILSHPPIFLFLCRLLRLLPILILFPPSYSFFSHIFIIHVGYVRVRKVSLAHRGLCVTVLVLRRGGNHRNEGGG